MKSITSMKTTMLIVGLTCVGWFFGLPQVVTAADPPIFRHQFRGYEALALEKGATRAREIARLAESKVFVEDLMGKLAVLPVKVWPETLSDASGQVAGWTAPLMADLFRAPTLSEIHGPTNRAEAALAVALTPERAALWSTNLWQLTHRGTGREPRKIQVAEFGGWEATVGEQGILQFVQAKDWVIVSVGQRPLEAATRMLRGIDRQGQPSTTDATAWFEVEADLAALGFWLPVFRGVDWPRVSLSARGDGENVRTSGRATFAGPIPWTFEPWQIPTNSIVEPIVSFTVGQGLAPLLKGLLGADVLMLGKLPNQFCMWGQPTEQRQAVLTVPMPDATNAIHTLTERLPAFLTKVMGRAPEKFQYHTDQTTLSWAALAPPAWPHLMPWEEGGREYLLGALLPVSRDDDPPPAALFAQLGSREDLIYYDWEITEERSLFATQVYQLYCIGQYRELFSMSSPPQQWLLTARPLLGNTTTEVVRSGPRELRLERKSHLGLTGFELVTLVQWIASPGFPATFELPPRLSRTDTSQPGAPASGSF